MTVVEFGAMIFGYCSKATFKAMKRARDVWFSIHFRKKNRQVQGLAIVWISLTVVFWWAANMPLFFLCFAVQLVRRQHAGGKIHI